MTEKKDGNPFNYNKEFKPGDENNIKAWLAMRPEHKTAGEWQFAIGELIEMMKKVTNETDRSKLMIGWKSKQGLL